MRYNTAIAHADVLRPNTVDSELKFMWLSELDGKIGEITGEEVANPYPNDDDLLMPFPYDNIYELYLIAMIDIYNQDTMLYQADYTLFNQAFEEARAYLVRNKDSVDQMFGVM